MPTSNVPTSATTCSDLCTTLMAGSLIRATCHVPRATCLHVRRATCHVPRATCLHAPGATCLHVRRAMGTCDVRRAFGAWRAARRTYSHLARCTWHAAR